MRFPKRTLIATLVATLISACGGSDDSTVATQKTLKAIDGYLIGAEVYVDRNKNGKADADEKLAQLTDESGNIAIPSADAGYDVIVKAIAGKTRDSDKGGTIDQSFELVAKGTSAVASPFTTIALAQDKSIEALATELGYDAATLSQDYVALKNSADDAAAAHLFARSIVSSLGMDKNSNAFAERTDTINSEITQLVNEGADLNEMMIYLSDTGIASVSAMQPTLEAFMDNQSYVSFSLNDFWRTRNSGEEFATWHFDIKNKAVVLSGDMRFTLAFDALNPNSFFMVMPKDPNTTCEYPYQSACRSEMQDDLIFMEKEFALAVSVDGDIQTYLKPNSTESIDYQLNGIDDVDLSESPIAQNAYYHLDDLSTDWSPKPYLGQIAGGAIQVTSAASGDISFGGENYKVLRGNGQVYLIKRVSDDHPSLLFRNGQLAALLKSKWENHSLSQPE